MYLVGGITYGKIIINDIFEGGVFEIIQKVLIFRKQMNRKK